MARNGAGVYSLPSGNPVVTGTTISSTTYNNTLTDIASALTGSVAADGQTAMTGNLAMGSNKITGLANASARTDVAATGQVQDGSFIYIGTVGGTADVITLTPSPAITSYTAGQTFRFIASGANTTNVTVNISGLGAKAITKGGVTALTANDILSGSVVEITYDGTQFQLNTGLAGGAVMHLAGTETITGNKTFSGNNTLSGSDTFSGTKTFSGAALNLAAEVSIASASTVNIGAAASNNILITGTTTITAFDTVSAGITRIIRFNGVLTLTNNNTSLILPWGTNITTKANDCFEFESLGSGNWICRTINKPSRVLLFDSGAISASAGVEVTSVIDNTKYLEYVVKFYNLVPAAATQLALQVSATNGAPYDSNARYVQSYHDSSSAGTGSDGGGNANTLMAFGGATNVTNAAPGLSGEAKLIVPPGAATGIQCTYDVTYTDGTNIHRVSGMNTYSFAVVVNAFKIFFLGQNISSGRFVVWGIPF